MCFYSTSERNRGRKIFIASAPRPDNSKDTRPKQSDIRSPFPLDQSLQVTRVKMPLLVIHIGVVAAHIIHSTKQSAIMNPIGKRVDTII